MPRYYCDYCDTYLTHDSPSVRKQHNAGYKHKANVRTYYQQFEEQQTQSLIDQKVKEHLGQAGYQQVGAAFHQHMTAMGGQYRPPLPLPLPLRPLIMPRPSPGYVMPPGMRPHTDANGLPQPPTLTPPGAPPGSFPTSVSSNPMPSAPGAPMSNGSYANAPPASGPLVNYPQNPGPPSTNTQYPAQQSFRTMAPSGQPSGAYAQGQTNAPGGYSGAQPAIQNYNA